MVTGLKPTSKIFLKTATVNNNDVVVVAAVAVVVLSFQEDFTLRYKFCVKFIQQKLKVSYHHHI
jgi:hypothetical protein